RAVRWRGAGEVDSLLRGGPSWFRTGTAEVGGAARRAGVQRTERWVEPNAPRRRPCLRLLGEPRLLRLLHGPRTRPAGSRAVGHVPGYAGHPLRAPLRREDGLRTPLRGGGRRQGRAQPGARGARGALRADAEA